MSETIQQEWFSFDVLLKRGEFPVIMDLIQLGKATNNAIYFIKRFEPGNKPIENKDIEDALLSLKKLKSRIDEAVAKETGLRIERRICQR